MHAVVSLLDETHTRLVEDLWQTLQASCALTGVLTTPFAHFSWHVAADYDFPRLEPLLEQVAIQTQPFTVRASGLGIFSNPTPVVYIPLVRNLELSRCHELLWSKITLSATDSSPYYNPEHWQPHITLAYNDVNRERLACALNLLAFQTLDWKIRVDHLAVVYQEEGQVGRLQCKFPFSQATYDCPE